MYAPGLHAFVWKETSHGEKGQDRLQVPAGSTGLIIPNYVHAINLLRKFLLRGKPGGNVPCSKLAGFTLMSYNCLPGRFEMKKAGKEMISRSAHVGSCG